MNIEVTNALSSALIQTGTTFVHVNDGVVTAHLKHHHTVDVPLGQSIQLPGSDEKHTSYTLVVTVDAPEQYQQKSPDVVVTGTTDPTVIEVKYFPPVADQPVIHYGLFQDATLLCDIGFAVRSFQRSQAVENT